VNLGSRGFLVEVEPHELDDALDRLDTGDFTIEEHSAAVLSDGCDESIAFNDISGQPALQLDGTIMRRMQPGEALDVRLIPRAGLVVRDA